VYLPLERIEERPGKRVVVNGLRDGAASAVVGNVNSIDCDLLNERTGIIVAKSLTAREDDGAECIGVIGAASPVVE